MHTYINKYIQAQLLIYFDILSMVGFFLIGEELLAALEDVCMAAAKCSGSRLTAHHVSNSDSDLRSSLLAADENPDSWCSSSCD